MVRGKESSNRIELSQLVQDLLNFGDLGSLQLWGVGVSGCGWGWVDGVGVGGWSGGGWRGAPTHMHMPAHACMVNMIISCKWLPPLGEYLGILYDVICACMCMYKCVGGTLSPPPLHPPTPTPWGTLRISQNSIALELIKIFQFCLKI